MPRIGSAAEFIISAAIGLKACQNNVLNIVHVASLHFNSAEMHRHLRHADIRMMFHFEERSMFSFVSGHHLPSTNAIRDFRVDTFEPQILKRQAFRPTSAAEDGVRNSARWLVARTVRTNEIMEKSRSRVACSSV